MSGQGTSLALIGACVLAGELAAASGAYQTAFDHYETEMRPFVTLNQALGLKSANLMRSKEQRSVSAWLIEKMMQLAPGPMVRIFYQSLDPAYPPGRQLHYSQRLLHLTAGCGRRARAVDKAKHCHICPRRPSMPKDGLS